MKTIGLIGGMSWESSSQYYSLVNRGVQAARGGNHSARCILYSFDFQDIENLQYQGNWELLREKIQEAGRALGQGGADFAVLCTNTMHKVVDDFESATGLQLLHIADTVGAGVRAAGLTKVGLLGTIFTMEQDFYTKRLVQNYGLEVLIPPPVDRQVVNRIIYEELVKGRILDASRQDYYRIMAELQTRGAQGIILGCTEIGLLVQDFDLPLFDSTLLHADAAIKLALSGD